MFFDAPKDTQDKILCEINHFYDFFFNKNR